jgi:carnitine 3-dehydrogenase
MNRVEPTKVKRVAVIGLGVTGRQWTTHFLSQGLEVVAYDPDTDHSQHPFWATLSGADHLTIAPDLATAVNVVDFVQESGPKKPETKGQLLAALDALTPPALVIAASTSDCAMTTLQQELHHPERCVVGHLFSTSDSIPFVEVVGGQRTDPAVVEWLMAFYRAIGKQPLKLISETPAFLTHRLQEAVWQEALEVVARGLATVKEIDAAMNYGPGRR